MEDVIGAGKLEGMHYFQQICEDILRKIWKDLSSVFDNTCSHEHFSQQIFRNYFEWMLGEVLEKLETFLGNSF